MTKHLGPIAAAGLLGVLMASGTLFSVDSSELAAGARIRITPRATVKIPGVITIDANRTERSGGAVEKTADLLAIKVDQQVFHIPRKTVVGKLVETDAEFLTVIRGAEQLKIPRAPVKKLEVSRRPSTTSTTCPPS